MRHFLRIDADVQIGPALGAVAFICHGETLHLDDSDPEQARVAEAVASASSGWVEVDDNGGAVTGRSRSAVATATVTEPVDPPESETEEAVAVWPPTQMNAPDPYEPPSQVESSG